ncbi:MAG: carboxypeptidase-like regulatory domain-containing protein [Tannerella sp.]|jgi:hypothetical protein|nr:carboxypeptidase-like regulatory domain-containing protein [Tannerella sp.]
MSVLLGNKRIIGVLVLLTIFFSIAANAQEPEISLQGRDLTLKEAFRQIEEQTKYTVAYNQSKLDVNRRIWTDIKNKKIKDVLSIILEGTSWTFLIREKHIVIVPADATIDLSKNTIFRQTIRGKVIDKGSGFPVPYANIVVLNNMNQWVITDSLGNFHLKNLPVGRYDVQVSLLGYESFVYRDILLTSAKEAFIEIPLEENNYSLEEIVITWQVNKEQALNPMAMAGSRMFSVEEANRFAGGFDDPARLVTSYAGVLGGIADNSISIHGNAPHLLQWRLEDIEIPNPNHFADLPATGGGVFTALSSQVMGNSDFYMGVFPAEYNNAYSGIFDMKMRNGNNEHYEHAVQASLLGLDVASEGPFGKGRSPSYLFNYRNSTLSLIKDFIPRLDVKDLSYQDLVFKLHFPTSKAGVFTVWGIGLIDKSEDTFEESERGWGSTRSIDVGGTQGMAAGGISNKIFLDKNTYLKTSLGLTFSQNNLRTDSMDYLTEISPTLNLQNKSTSTILNLSVNRKFSSAHTNKTGMIWNTYFYDLNFRKYLDGEYLNEFIKEKGNTALFSAYSNSLVRIGNDIIINAGINLQAFTLNGNWTLEPRIGLKWNLISNQSLALAYGMHSRLERLATYFMRSNDMSPDFINKELDFIKSHHLTLSYQWKVSNHMIFRFEPYYQYLYNVPIVPNTTFSTVNGLPFIINVALKNEGKGRNMGIDCTLEHFLEDGIYYLFSGSLFDSKYSNDNKIWYNTCNNNTFLLRALGGKEWFFGKNKQYEWSVNLKMSLLGGERYTPIDMEYLEVYGNLIYDYERSYEEQFPVRFITDFTTIFRINRSEVFHEFAFKILNLTGTPEYTGQIYDLTKNKVVFREEKVVLPNISYKIGF